MHITAATPVLSGYQGLDSMVSPVDRLAEALERKPEAKPLPKVDLVGDWVVKIMRDKQWGMIYGADEEETGMPRIEYEL